MWTEKYKPVCEVDAMNRSLENIVDDEEVKQRKFESYLSLVGLGLGGGLFLIIILTARTNILQSSSRKLKTFYCFFLNLFFSQNIDPCSWVLCSGSVGSRGKTPS